MLHASLSTKRARSMHHRCVLSLPSRHSELYICFKTMQRPWKIENHAVVFISMFSVRHHLFWISTFTLISCVLDSFNSTCLVLGVIEIMGWRVWGGWSKSEKFVFLRV